MSVPTCRYLEFMSREGAAKKLKGQRPGTFMIRFSDGEIGGVSIAWVQEKEGIAGTVPVQLSFFIFEIPLHTILRLIKTTTKIQKIKEFKYKKQEQINGMQKNFLQEELSQ